MLSNTASAFTFLFALFCFPCCLFSVNVGGRHPDLCYRTVMTLRNYEKLTLHILEHLNRTFLAVSCIRLSGPYARLDNQCCKPSFTLTLVEVS